MLHNSLLAAFQNYWEDANEVEHYDYPDRWTQFAKDNLSAVFLWATVALAAILLVVGIVVYLKKREALPRYATVAVALAVGFSLAVIVPMLALEFMDMVERGAVFDLVLYPTVALGACVLLGAAAIYISSLFGRKPLKITTITALSVAGAALVALLVCLGFYLGSGEGELNNDVSINLTENILLYVCAAVLVGLLFFFAFFFGRKDKTGFDTKAIAYAAICIAMSFALSYLAPIHMPQGGSVTIASLLPLMIYSYMFGVKKGIFAGFVYGLLQAVQDPWIIHPAQFLLDYPIAFAFIGIAGIFANVKKLDKLPQIQFGLGAIAAGALRYVSHVLSGVFAFSEWAGSTNPWIYSLGYNSFVFADVAIVVAVGILVFCSPTFVKAVRKFRAKKPAETAENTENTEKV